LGFHRFLQASLFTIYYTAGGSSAALDVPWLVGEAWHLANRMGKLLRLMMICPDSDRHPDPRFSAGPAARRQARYAIIPQFSRFATDGSNRGPIPSQDRYNKLLSSKRNSFVPKWTHPIPIPMDNCPTCQTPNRELARFCRACGAWLLPRCPFCDAEILLPSAFCDQCGRVLNSEAPTPRSAETPEEASPLSLGAPIREEAASPASPLQSLIPAEMQARLKDARQDRAMEGQRRVVTMMFCDVQGSTAAANRFDPEEWAGIINGAFECMIPPVYHFEGTVARLMGDGILAFFGAPIAHEDDPQRAVLAGLEILEKFTRYKALVSSQWGVEIDARVGINTGLVVVGAVGSDLQVEYTAVGDAINIAARMEQTAAPGTLQISDVTHKRVASHFKTWGSSRSRGSPNRCTPSGPYARNPAQNAGAAQSSRRPPS
jgi:class 3 adenylate cyclase